MFSDAEKYHHENNKWFSRQKYTDDEAIVFVLYSALEDDPTMTLRAYQQLLRDYGVMISISTIHRWWRSQDITFKKIRD